MIYWFLFSVSFFGTLYAMPRSIRKLKENNYLVKDMYKSSKPFVPTNAGTIVLFISFISIALTPLFLRFMDLLTPYNPSITDLSEKNLAFLLVVSIYAVYGLVDDLVDIGRKLKFILPITFGYPLISIVNPQEVWIPLFGNFNLDSVFFGSILWNDIFKVFIVPIYVMVVSNLVNMHSGYNGLQSGLSIIIITTLIFKSFILGDLSNIYPAIAFLGSIIAFWIYNRYPSKVFEGNIGSLLFGSVIGCIIVIQQLWWFGFFILIPHTFNFLLWMYWVLMFKLNPDEYLEADGNHKKFGTLDSNGFIQPPNRLTLKWIPNYYWKLNEPRSVLLMYIITLFFCITGLLITS